MNSPYAEADGILADLEAAEGPGRAAAAKEELDQEMERQGWGPEQYNAAARKLTAAPATLQDLAKAESRLAVAVESVDAARAMFEAIRAKFTSKAGVLDVEKALAQARKTLAGHGVDLDEPMTVPAGVAPAPAPKPIDQGDAPEVAAQPAKKRPKDIFWAPDRIFDTSLRLDDKARLIYLCLSRFADSTGMCWPGSRTLASACGFHSRDVAPAVQELISRGMVEIASGEPGRPHGYRVLPPDRWKQVSPTVETVGVSPHRLQGVSTPSPVA